MDSGSEFEKSASAGYLANHMARLFALALAERIRPLGLMPAQFPVLLELWQGDGLTQKELVARLDVEQATMANTLARMERDGLIRRRPHPRDGRAQSVHLTARARKLEGEAKSAAMAVNEVALSGFSCPDCDRLVGAMGRVIANLRGGQDGA